MQLADVKKGITDEDILALATDEANQPAVVWDLADLQVTMPGVPCFAACRADALTLRSILECMITGDMRHPGPEHSHSQDEGARWHPAHLDGHRHR